MSVDRTVTTMMDFLQQRFGSRIRIVSGRAGELEETLEIELTVELSSEEIVDAVSMYCSLRGMKVTKIPSGGLRLERGDQYGIVAISGPYHKSLMISMEFHI